MGNSILMQPQTYCNCFYYICKFSQLYNTICNIFWFLPDSRFQIPETNINFKDKANQSKANQVTFVLQYYLNSFYEIRLAMQQIQAETDRLDKVYDSLLIL